MTRRQAVSHRLAALMTKAEQTFAHDGGAVYLPRVIITATEDAWSAFAARDYDRAERILRALRRR